MRNLLLAIIFILWLILGFFYRTKKVTCCGENGDDISHVSAMPDSKDLDESIATAIVDKDSMEIVEQDQKSATDNIVEESNQEVESQEEVSNDIGNAEEKGDLEEATYTEGQLVDKQKGKTIYYFESASKKLPEEIRKDLWTVAKKMKNNFNKLIINGHTDNEGGPSANYNLGLKRAESIKNELIRLGVSPQRILTYSKGDKRPIASNDTAEGRKQNRRTELILTN